MCKVVLLSQRIKRTPKVATPSFFEQQTAKHGIICKGEYFPLVPKARGDCPNALAGFSCLNMLGGKLLSITFKRLGCESESDDGTEKTNQYPNCADSSNRNGLK